MAHGRRELLEAKPWRTATTTLPGSPWGFLGHREARLLHDLARDYFRGDGVLVDAGAFLGCSAWHFAKGLERNDTQGRAPRRLVHCFDNFIANDDLTTEAIEAQFGERLVLGASTRHLFDQQTRDVAGWLEVHEGDFHTYDWPPSPIEILLVDIAKAPSLNRRVLEVFFPHLMPGRSIVVHQDYHHPWLPHIHVAMECLRDYFELVEPKVDDSAAFLLTRPIPPEVLAAAARSHERPFDEQLALMERAITGLPADTRRHVELARANMLRLGRGDKAMREAMREIDDRYPADDPDDLQWGRYRRDMLQLLENAPADLARGWALADGGDAASALALAETVRQGHRQYADALILRAHALRRLARQRDARPLLEQAVALRPRHAPSLIEAAWLDLEDKRYAAGAETARRALACAVDGRQRAFANNVLALNLSMAGHHAEAGAAGQAALSALPDLPWMLVQQAQCRQRAGDAAGARELAARALALQPGIAGARAVLDASGGRGAS